MQERQTGLGHSEIGPGHAGFGTQKIRPCRSSLRFCQIMDVIVARIRTDRARKDRGHVTAQLVNSGHNDMARRLVIELLDALAEIGLGISLRSRAVQGTGMSHSSVSIDLLFDQRLGATRREDVITI